MAPIITIERHILDQQRLYPDSTGAFSQMLYDIALSAKIIARETTRAGLVGILGASDDHNVYGEQQQKLDLFANDMIFKMNDHTGRLCAMASEENDTLIPIPAQFKTGKYVLLYDPLDGSSNIDVNVSIGTIFSVHRKISKGDQGTLEDALQPGRRLAAAGYVVYGSSTMMVYSAGNGVHGFTLDPSVGEFLLSHENIRVPNTAKYYSANQGYEKYWTPGVRRFTKWLQGIEGEGREPLAHRYIGSLVADFHRNLLRGGIFYYPGDMQKRTEPAGKMRLMFEAQALAFLADQAGGYASDGVGNILDIQPHDLHQRVPMFIGNRDLVVTAETYIRNYDQDWVKAYTAFREKQAVFSG
ncbi:MAG: class 1 fructose-bisphosphatase [Anaerolineaceae bacterium]|nr:class 1 fructose-bisphosphatase [Anaerolineaceae bacterium]